ncbi:isoaspartyl peptidase/L-asparaginase family protein [Glaciecola sp. 1036]|uniref:isoaspartyl peptidase/L-asparaginase family protein n=1 Tax=Alteromonadaceae TaxID=72275 RepID=UPI003CFDC4C4
MKAIFRSIAICVTALFVCFNAYSNQPIAIVLHGGAGTISPDKMTKEVEAAYYAKLNQALDAGYAVLKDKGEGLDAVVATITILENSPLFNAGVGAVYTYEGEHELDASIMHGKERQAGAVAGVKTIQNPILAARLVMEKSVHVMLSGQGAESFAHEHGLAKIDNTMFDTQRRFDALQKAKQRIDKLSSIGVDKLGADMRFGTVGAVVLDAQGNIVAGTSTGGMTAKRYGRVGDSPIIGAGTFADNASCGVSATGHGEFFIRYNVASDICARMKYQHLSLQDAANQVINVELKAVGGDGGIIALDAKGNVAMPFNTSGMYRASIDGQGKRVVAIYK